MRILLVGLPNCGKTSLFNVLTGSKQKVANYSGVTIDKKTGIAKNPIHKKSLGLPENYTVLDLPGIYGFCGHSLDEQVTLKQLELYANKQDTAVVLVINASQLKLGLRFYLQFSKIVQGRFALLLNLFDTVGDKQKQISAIYKQVLEQHLGVPVIPMSTQSKSAYFTYANTFWKTVQSLFIESQTLPLGYTVHTDDSYIDNLDPQGIVQTCIQNLQQALPQDKTAKFQLGALKPVSLDNWLLHPVYGRIILVAVFILFFQSVFYFGKMIQDSFQDILFHIGDVVLGKTIGSGPLYNLLHDGIWNGVVNVLAFLPQILILYLFIVILEDSGYLARASFLVETTLRKWGLPNKAFIPLMSSFACAIPGILSTRTMENTQDRLQTILVAPLTTCSARLPVYTLLIAAFLPYKHWGIFNTQGLVLLGLYVFGTAVTLLVAFVIRHFWLIGPSSPFILEIPSLRLPKLQNIGITLYQKGFIFVKRAGTLIVLIMTLLWFFSNFPAPPTHATQPDIYYSVVGRLGHWLLPLFAPIGFNWQIIVSLIPGMAAREAVIAGLASVYSINNQDNVEKLLTHSIQHNWSFATALSLLVWYAFSPQCTSTLVVVYKETGHWKYPVIQFCYMLSLAYMSSFVVYHIFS
jgi:ferrous iron transport protein B